MDIVEERKNLSWEHSFEVGDFVVYNGIEVKIESKTSEYIILTSKNYKKNKEKIIFDGKNGTNMLLDEFMYKVKSGQIRKIKPNEIFINENNSIFVGDKIMFGLDEDSQEKEAMIIKKYLRENDEDDIIVFQAIDYEDEFGFTVTKAYLLSAVKSGEIKINNDSDPIDIDVSEKEDPQKEEPKKEDFDAKQITEIIDETKEKFIAQENAVELLGAHIFNNLKVNEKKDPYYIKSQKSNILLDGSTGTGKTAIVNELASRLKLPIYKTEITNFTSTGYVGRELSELLVGLLKAAGGDLEKAQQGIIILDEFDKVAAQKTTAKGGSLSIQNELLPYLDGSVIFINYEGKKIAFDTSKITFICVGAFTTLRNKGLGILDKADYESYGLSKEILGRINTLISTKTYEFEDYKNILMNSTISPYKSFIQFCETYDVPVVLFPGFIDAVCEEACELNLGVRGLNEIFSRLRNYCLSDLIRNKSKMILLSKELICDSKKFGR